MSIDPDGLPDRMRASRFIEDATPAAGEFGHDRLVSWSEPYADAWVGLLETHRS